MSAELKRLLVAAHATSMPLAGIVSRSDLFKLGERGTRKKYSGNAHSNGPIKHSKTRLTSHCLTAIGPC
jgi:hypothetical protein